MIKRTTRAILLGLALTGLAACARHGDDAVVLRDPDTASRLRVAGAAAAAGQTDIALSMYAAAAEAAPGNVEAQTRFVTLLIGAGRPELANQVLTRALSRNANDPVLLRWRGILLLETGATAEALAIFDALLARTPRDVAALNGRGMALDLANRPDEAQRSYRAALNEAPSDIRTANNLAVSLLLAGRAAEARAVLLPLSQLPDVSPRVLNNLALAQAAAGDPAGADASLAGRPEANDIRALATVLGAPVAAEDAPHPPASGTSRSLRPTG